MSSLLEKIKPTNPIGLITMFAGLAEVAITVTLFELEGQNQYIFLWFAMLFPTGLVIIFFLILLYDNKILYHPSTLNSGLNGDLMETLVLALHHLSDQKKSTEFIKKLGSDGNVSNIKELIEVTEINLKERGEIQETFFS